MKHFPTGHFVALVLAMPLAPSAALAADSTAHVPPPPRASTAKPAARTTATPAKATPAPAPAAKQKSPAAAEQRELAAEEKDRLARERRELEARIALMQKQVELSGQLAAQKEQMRKLLLEELRLLKSAP